MKVKIDSNDPMVNHPNHYNWFGIECWEVVRNFNYHRGNAIRYIWRAGIKNKDSEVQDLEKAVASLQDEIARVKQIRDKQ